MVEQISQESMYAIKFLDNGGNFETFSKRHKKIHNAILEEYKRRMMVQIRYGMEKLPKFKTMVYKKIKQKNKLEPADLYKALETLSFDTLKHINKTLSHDSK
jgi:hypothetical protein